MSIEKGATWSRKKRPWRGCGFRQPPIGERIVSAASNFAAGCTTDGDLLVKPEIRSDNGSGYVAKEFYGELSHHGLTHARIKPHCLAENKLVEWANRTIRDALGETNSSAPHSLAETKPKPYSGR